MPRKIGSKNKNTGTRFKTYEGRFGDDKHIRLTKNMLDDKHYKKLSSSAKVLYLYMKLWACGRDEVEFSISLSRDFMANKTFIKSRNELLKEGFLEYKNQFRAKDFRETSKYKFSDKWASDKKNSNK